MSLPIFMKPGRIVLAPNNRRVYVMRHEETEHGTVVVTRSFGFHGATAAYPPSVLREPPEEEPKCSTCICGGSGKIYVADTDEMVPCPDCGSSRRLEMGTR